MKLRIIISIHLFAFLWVEGFSQWADSLELAHRNIIREMKVQVDSCDFDRECLKTMLSIGERYNWILGQPDTAIFWFEKARSLSEPGSEIHGLSYFYESAVYQNAEDYEKMLACINKAKPIFQNLGMWDKYSSSLLIEGDYYGLNGPVEKAFIVLSKAEHISDSIGEYRNAAIACSNMGRFYYDQGRLGEALQQMLRSVEYRRKGELPLSSGLIMNIGSTFMESENFPKAISYFKTAIILANSGEDRFILGEEEVDRNIADAYFSLGECFEKSFEIDSAKRYLDKALVISEQLEDSSRIAKYYLQKGNIAKSSGSIDQALVNYEKALQFFVIKTGVNQQVLLLLKLAEGHIAYCDLHSIQPNQKYLKYAQDAYQLATEAGLYDKRVRAAYLLFELHRRSGNYQQASTFAKEYMIIKDSLFTRDRSAIIADMQTKYETERIESQNRMLEDEKELQEARIQQQNLILIGVAIVSIFLLVIAVLIYQSRKKLHLSNQEIVKQNEEKDLLLKEIHHRVKNNLQVVSSLLDLQSRGIEDEKALSTFMEGQNRVKAMALIHQRLYQNKDLSTIDFAEYAKNLLSELGGIYEMTKNVKTNVIASGNTHFDIDTAIPLGLILNELICNAYKYAFKGSSEGELRVHLDEHENGKYKLVVSDNGKGLPEGFDAKKAKSLGLRLVRRLSRQLHGEFEYINQQGAKFVIGFTDTLHRKAV